MGYSEKNIDLIKTAIAKGNADALAHLYKLYFSKLKLYGLQFSQKLNTYSVDDTIQEIFIWLAKNPKALKNVDNIEVYLFSALKQNIYQEIHKNEIHKKVKRKFTESNNFPIKEFPIENKIIESEEHTTQTNYISHLLESLPPNQKEVIYLRYYVNMSYREIAQVMDLSEQVVRNYAYRAMQQLRKQPSLNRRQFKR